MGAGPALVGCQAISQSLDAIKSFLNLIPKRLQAGHRTRACLGMPTLAVRLKTIGWVDSWRITKSLSGAPLLARPARTPCVIRIFIASHYDEAFFKNMN